IRDWSVTGVQTCALPISRANGEVVNPAVELRNAIRGLAFLADEFPGFVDALGAPTSGPDSRLTRQYYWMERRLETDNVLALSARSEERRVGKEGRACEAG